MALLQISEPGQSPSPHQFKRAAGIDLGTTNSLVATVRGAQSQVIAAEDGSEILPSAVYYGSVETLVGQAALQQSLIDPSNALTSFKRWMGRGYDDLKNSTQFDFVDNGESLASVKTDAGDVNAIQASSEVLRRLAERAESFLGGPLAGVVITVPAYFDDSQRQATRDAATVAGLDVLRLINEPTAAALAYGIDKQDDRFVAIYDLGGGTFDISVLQLSEGVFEVLATGGDASLGGDDFDQVIVDWALQSSGFSIDSLNDTTRSQLYAQARTAKHTLSSESSVKLSLIRGQDHWQGELSAEMFVQLIEPKVEATLTACRRCLDDAELEPEDIADVVLVGGSTRVPLVRSKVAELFAQSPRDEVDPDKVVALGAAIQADALVGNEQKQDLLLLDVLPLSLGIETMGGLVEKIISRNTAIPCRMAQEFTTQKDGQTALAVHVLQGERERVSDCRSLARFELRGIPPMVAGAARIKVIFDIDANGLLAVTATEETTNISAEITVQPSSGLKEEQITEMLKASYQYAEADRDARMLVEQQVDAQALLDSIEMALEADSDLLDVEELAAIQSTMEALDEVKTSNDVEGIRQSIKALSDQTESFAARRMDKSIKQALAGRSLNDFASETSDVE